MTSFVRSAFTALTLLLATLSAQTSFIERGVAAGDSPSTYTTAERLFSIADLQADPSALEITTSTAGAGYLISRTGTSLVKRRTTFAEGIEMTVSSASSASAADLTAIPAFTFNGQTPATNAYVLIEKERVDVSAADASAATALLRINASLALAGTPGLRSQNRIWSPTGTASLLVSGTIYRRSGNQRISDFSTAFAITKAVGLEGPITTVDRVFGTGQLGTTITPDFPGVGVAGGSGAWNSLSEDGTGYIDLNVPNGSYVEFSVTLRTSANIQNTGNQQSITGAALASFNVAATGRVWASTPFGGRAVGTFGTTLRSQSLASETSVFQLRVGDAPISLAATSSSGLPVTTTLLSGPATLTGTTLAPTGQRGRIAYQHEVPGNNDFYPQTFSRSIDVVGLDQTLTFPPLASRPADSPAFIPDATASSGLPVTFTVSEGPAATADGRTITLTGGTGTVRLLARQLGNAVYEPTLAIERSFSVTAATGGSAPQAINFPSLLSAEVGTGQLLAATATSGLPVTYSVIVGSATIGGPNNNILTATAPGLVTVRASQAGGVNNATTFAAATPIERSFNASPATTTGTIPQIIAFSLPANVPLGVAPITLNGQTSSSLPITYTVTQGQSIASLSGDVLTLTGVGTVSIRADQPGDSSYAPASVERTVLVIDPTSPIAQTIQTNGFPLNLTANGTAVLLSPSSTSGLTVTTEILSTYPEGIATLSGNQLSASAAGYVTLLLTQPGGVRHDTTYSEAPPVEVVIPVLPSAMRAQDLHGAWTLATPEPGVSLALVFAADGNYYHGEAGNEDPAGEDGLEVGTYTWSTLLGSLTATPTLDQNGEWGLSHPLEPFHFIVSGDTLLVREGDSYFTLQRIRSTSPLVGAWRIPVEGGVAVITFLSDGTYLHLETATADEAGQPGLETGTYTWNSSTGSIVTTQTLDQNGEWGLSHNAPDFALSVTGDSLTIREGGATIATVTRLGAATATRTQTINFARPASRAFGSAAFDLRATASSGLPVTFSVVSGSATLGGTEGRTLTLEGAGEVVIRASQAGDATFLPATSIDQTLVVTRAAQRITFPQPAPVTYGDEPFSLPATSSSGLPVTYEIVSSTPAGAAAYDTDLDVLLIQGAGRVVLRAVQPGDSNYAPAAAVTRTLVINKAVLTVFVGDATRLVGQPNPVFDLSYAGWVGDDSEDAITTHPTTSTTATVKSPAGSYPVTFKGGLAANYTFAPASASTNGTLTVVGFGGTYEALLVDQALTPVGKLVLTVPANALTFSGTLTTAAEGRSVSFKSLPSTPLIPSSEGTSVSLSEFLITLNGTAYNLDLTLDSEGSVTGSLTRDAEPFASLSPGARRYVPAPRSTAPWSGTYTFVLLPAANLFTEGPLPSGSGHASASIDAKGSLKLTGKLADGTILTATVLPDDSGTYRLYLNPYGTRAESFLAGALALQAHPDADRFPSPRFYIPADAGLLVWQKAPSPAKPLDKSYRDGFGPLAAFVALDPWIAPSPASTLPQLLGLAESNNASATLALTYLPDDLDLGESDSTLPTALTLTAAAKLTVPLPNPRAFKLTSFNAKTGAFSGTFSLSDQVNPSPAKPVVRSVSFSGTLRQPPSGESSPVFGAGHFLLPGFPVPKGSAPAEQSSGELLLTAPPAE